MIKYKIVLGHGNENTFNRQVQEYLDSGWKLQGGVSIAWTNNGLYYSQAITKETETEIKK